MSNSDQIKILNEKFWSSRYLNAGIMYFGLTGGELFAVKHFLSGRKFPIVSKLFGVKKIGRTVIEDKIKCLHLFQCFLETCNNDLVQKIGGYLLNDMIDLSNNALLLKDIHIFSFFLIKSANKTWKKLDLSSCFIGDHGFDVFTRSFTECSNNKTIIESVDISNNHLTSVSINGIISLIDCFKTEKIVLINNNIDYEAFDDKLLKHCNDDNRAMKVVVEKQSDEVNFYCINCQFNVKKDLALFPPNGNWNIYLWSSIFQFNDLKMFVSKHCNGGTNISVYAENLKNLEQAVNMASELEQLCYCTNSQLEYVLQTCSSLFATNSTKGKIRQALSCECFFYYNNSEISDVCQWKNVHIHKCLVGNTDFQAIVSVFLRQKATVCFNVFDISECCLTGLSINIILQLLKHCVIKNFVVSDNSIPNNLLQNGVSNKCIQSELQNFKEHIPLTLFNDSTRHDSDSSSDSAYSVTKYLVNCDIDDETVATVRNLANHFVAYDLFLWNVNILDKNIKELELLCENPFLNINLFQMCLQEDCLCKLASTLHNSTKLHYSYVLCSSSKLLAYKAKQNSITEGLNNGGDIDALELVICEFEASNFSALQNTFSSSSQHWTTINLSGCNIGDVGCNALCESLQTSAHHISKLNLCNNDLSHAAANVIATLLQHCTLEELDLSQNKISQDDIRTSLSSHYSTKMIKNFVHKTLLLVNVSAQQKDLILGDMSCIYLILTSLDLEALQNLLTDNEKVWGIYLVDDVSKKIYTTIQYSNLTLRMFPVPTNMFDKLQNITSFVIRRRHIANIDLSNCKLGDIYFNALCKRLFSSSSVLKFIRQLDLSDNELSSLCLCTLKELLCHCIVEQLIIAGNDINDNVFNEALCKQYWNDKILLNFVNSIPLAVYGTIFEEVIICNLYITAFGNPDNICHLQILDNARKYNVYHIKSNGIFSMVFSFVLNTKLIMNTLYSDVTDKILPIILNSTKFIFSRKYKDIIDLSQFNHDSNICSVFCRTLFNKQTSLRHLSTLIFFSTALSFECLSTFVDCFQYCSFDYIVVSEGDTFNVLLQLLLCRYLAGKAKYMLNSISGKPLTLISQPVTNCYVECVITFMHCKETDNFNKAVDSLVKHCNAKSHHLVVFNSLSKTGLSLHLNYMYYLQELAAHNVYITVYEIGLKDEMALEIVELCTPILDNVQYVLATDTMFIVSGAELIEYVQELENFSYLDTVIIERCRFFQEEFVYVGKILSTKNHLKRITFSICSAYVDDIVYKNLSETLFQGETVISYLKVLNISHNDITSSSVNTIASS